MSKTPPEHEQMEIRCRFATFVLELLEEKHWSKEELGRAISVSGTAVQGWSGTNNNRSSTVDPMSMKVGAFFKLAELRGWTGDQLYEFLVECKPQQKPFTSEDELVSLLNQAITIIKRDSAL